MNILLLSNSAPNYHYFFNALAQCFAKDGAKVVVAVDCTFSRRKNEVDTLGFDVFDFSIFFKNHQINREILERYSRFNLNGALLSDFERAEIYKIWSDEVGIDFYDRLKSALLSYFEEIFNRYKINVVIYENVSNSFAYFALLVAQRKGAVYCGIGGSRLPGRFTITSDPLADNKTAKIFESIQSGCSVVPPEVRQWASEYIATIETVVPDYMNFNGLDRISLIERYLKYDLIEKVKPLLLHVFDNRTDAFQVGNPWLTHFNRFHRNILRRIKVEQVEKLYQMPVNGERFVLYPLHFHPETSTSILAGAYLNEYEVIRNIAFNLPEGMRLYVKDHMSAWGYPPLNFYNRIKRLPNVRLLGPNAPTKQLIKDSIAVITLTSTVGYEALLLKKRVFLFGRVFYEFHKGVTKIEDPMNLHELMLRWINKPIDWDDAYNNDFICAYHQATLPNTLNLMLKSDAAKQLAKQIYPIVRSQVLDDSWTV